MLALLHWFALPALLASPLTYAAAQEKLLATHPSLTAGRLQARAEETRTRGVGAWEDPMAGLQLWNMPLNHVEGALLPGIPWQQRAVTFARGPEMFPVMVMLSQAFPWPGKKSALTGEQVAVAHAASAKVHITQADLSQALSYAWADAQAAAAAQDNLSGGATLLDALVELAGSRLATGLGRTSEVLAAQMERENLRQAQSDLAQQGEVARARLCALLGLAHPQDLTLSKASVVDVSLQPRDQLLAAAWDRRAELAEAKAQIAAAKMRARAAQLAVFPDVTANVAYMAQVGGAGMVVDQGPYRALLGPSDMVTVGVTLPLPVWAPWKQVPQADAARLEAQRAAANLESVILMVQAQVDEALAGVAHARAHLALHQGTLLSLSARALDAAQRDYASGLGDLGPLLSAARVQRSHQLDHVGAQLQLARHLADLERATGLPLLNFMDPAVATPNQGGTP